MDQILDDSDVEILNQMVPNELEKSSPSQTQIPNVEGNSTSNVTELMRGE